MIPLLDPATYTVTRYTDGAYTNGLPNQGTSSTFTIRASIQPMSGAAAVCQRQRRCVLLPRVGLRQRAYPG
jgi:hypothetical protein